jgi:thiol-disulfide isomerase/thioredoxin
LAFLALFGLVLLSEQLSAKFAAITQSFANLGSRLATHTSTGFSSGLWLGVLTGLIWTPCAGPILAAVLVQIIRQQSDLNAWFLTAAFALGAGLPMMVIALLGRRVIDKLGFFTQHAEAVRKTFGVIILVAVGLIASGINVQALAWNKESSVLNSQGGLIQAIPNPYPAPEFAGIDAWLNSKPLTMAKLKGKVVLVDFWTYSCINCLSTLPMLIKWDQTYRDKGLEIIGVHSPEFEFEKNASNVQQALKAQHIAYPVALDSQLDTWTNFNNHYWPASYLIDREGRIVYVHYGEGNDDVTEHNIRFLLGLKNHPVISKEPTFNRIQTPETYLGSARAMNLARDADTLSLNEWALLGKWQIEDERIVAEEANAALRFNFIAAKVFLVMGAPKDKPIKVNIILNGKPAGEIMVNEYKLYTVINQPVSTQGLLEIRVDSPGLEAYAFTFGN